MNPSRSSTLPPPTRSPRKTAAETGRIVKVKLAYNDHSPFGKPYQIIQITNEIAVPISKESRHVGDYLTEAEATDLLTEPGVEVTTVPAK